MAPRQEDFDALRRLLALKRYEQPPPGFFQSFPRQIILGIEKADRVRQPGLRGWLSQKLARLQELWDSLESNPAVAGAFGFAVCGFLASGFYFAENSGTAHDLGRASFADIPTVPAALTGLREANAGALEHGRNPSLFEEMRRARNPLRAQPVNWQGNRLESRPSFLLYSPRGF